MTEKKADVINPPAEPKDETWLDLATKEVVTVNSYGECRYSPQESVFDFYVSMNRFPTRNGGK